jgi:hypothetical protein
VAKDDVARILEMPVQAQAGSATAQQAGEQKSLMARTSSDSVALAIRGGGGAMMGRLNHDQGRLFQRYYSPRVVGGKIMTPADLRRLHKYMLEIEKIAVISDDRGRSRAECGARSPAGAGLWAHLFCRCSLFDRFFGGLFALSIGFVQEPIDDARTALLFDPSLLRFLLFGEELVISFPAH